MIFKPEPKVMQAFASLQSNANFMTVMKFIQDCRDRTDDEGRKQPEEFRVRWCQGGSQDLTELLNLSEMSRKL